MSPKTGLTRDYTPEIESTFEFMGAVVQQFDLRNTKGNGGKIGWVKDDIGLLQIEGRNNPIFRCDYHDDSPPNRDSAVLKVSEKFVEYWGLKA